MKILILGTNFFNYSLSLEKAFRELGHEVKTYVPTVAWDTTLIGRIDIKRSKYFNKITGKKYLLYAKPKWIRTKESENVYSVYSSYCPDLIVGFPGYYLTKDVLQKISCKKIIWIYDSVFRLPYIYETLSCYDKIFYFEGSDKRFFLKKNLPALFLPLCADNEVYYPIKCNKDIDISFVGNLDKKRIEMLLRIKRKHPDYSIVVYGTFPSFGGIPFSMRKQMKQYPNMFFNKNISPSEANVLYSRSKLCINLHHSQTKYGANMRFFELMASNSCQIVDENPYIKTQFSKCVLTYKNDDELFKLIDWYMKRKDKREIIAKNGFTRVNDSELFYHRAKFILDSIE